MNREGLASVTWFLKLVTAPSSEPVSLAFVRDDHLRVTNGAVEDDWIERAIRTATRMAQRVTGRFLMPQTHDLVMTAFPCGAFSPPHPPLISVPSITYVDADGETQTLDTSLYQVSAPIGPHARPGIIAPAYGEVWPTTRLETLEAVTVRFRAGYTRPGSPETADVPDDIVSGMLLVIGELYKQRSLSVHTVQNTPAVIRARDLWLPYKAY
jgi:uncharacterized phiE125 gp8 family phage protein